VNAEINLRVPINAGEFLKQLKTGDFLRKDSAPGLFIIIIPP
jgi:hypothetical protein